MRIINNTGDARKIYRIQQIPLAKNVAAAGADVLLFI